MLMNKSMSEIVQQLGMIRTFAGFAEVVGGSDQPFAKDMLPDAIHEDSRR